MNRKKWLNQKRKCEKAQPLVMKFVGTVQNCEAVKRKINRNRAAALKLEIVSADNRFITALVQYGLIKRLAALPLDTQIEATLQRFSKEYRRSDNEFELIDFSIIPATV